MPPRHARITPSSLENRNDALAPLTGKLAVDVLATSPVGPPATVGRRASAAPFGVWTLERSAPLSATHQGDVALASSPHAFTTSGLVLAARPETFEASLWTSYEFVGWAEAVVASAPNSASVATSGLFIRSPDRVDWDPPTAIAPFLLGKPAWWRFGASPSGAAHSRNAAAASRTIACSSLERSMSQRSGPARRRRVT